MAEQDMVNEKAHIRCNIIIEVLGKPQKHVEETIRKYVDKIRQDSDLVVMKATFSEAVEKDDYWSIFVELDVVVKGMIKLIAFCFDYMPSSIEITKPDEFMLPKKSIEDFANNLQSRLHQVDMIVKQLRNENDYLKANLNKSVMNTILISLSVSKLDLAKLSKVTGVREQELKMYLDPLLKDNKIKEEDNVYRLVEHA